LLRQQLLPLLQRLRRSLLQQQHDVAVAGLAAAAVLPLCP
jgi:hypothetical protein